MMPEFANAYQSTPVEALSKVNKGELAIRFGRAISNLQSKSVALRDHFVEETERDRYFQIAPVSAMVKVGSAVDNAFFILSQLLMSLSPQARTEILDGSNRQRIYAAIESQKQVCMIVRQQATDQSTRDVFQRIEKTCVQVTDSYFSFPKESQPDQILQVTNEPQELLVNEEDEQVNTP